MKNKKNAISIDIIAFAQSLNYGEGMGNLSLLKKLTGTDGKIYTYISSKAMCYSVKRTAEIDDSPIERKGSGDKGVNQYSAKSSPTEYMEQDLRGYTKTVSKDKDNNKKGSSKKRSAVVRVSDAISLTPYTSDMDFGANIGMSERGGFDNNLVQTEIHRSYYAYNVCIDLDRVGFDPNYDMDLKSEERAERVIILLEALQFLYRDIKGRRENMTPIFAIGGMYERKTPYFYGRIKADSNNLNVNLLKNAMNSCDDTRKNTMVGYLEGTLNDKEIKELSPVTVEDFFNNLKKEVLKYYESN